MELSTPVVSQYLATLAMLEEAVRKCPDDMWADPKPMNAYYQIAYHALFYCHLYVQSAVADFVPWKKHVIGQESFGEASYPGAPVPEPADPYTKEEVLEYLELCKQEVKRIVPELNWEAESGFPWLPFGKLELQFYSMRHMQGHAGELAERLSSQREIMVDWIGVGETD